MSPFAAALRQLRFTRGLRQQELADRMGYERSYLSVLENDVKQAPPAEFVTRLVAALGLDAEAHAALELARCKSRRHYSVPPQVAQDAYEVAHQFFENIEVLSELQLQGLKTILLLGQQASARLDGRIYRKDRGVPRGRETAM